MYKADSGMLKLLFIFFLHMFGLDFSDIRYFPPLGQCITQKGGDEYFEDYATFVHKADLRGFQK